MQHLEISCAVRPLKWSLGVKWLYSVLYYYQRSTRFGRSFHPSSGAYKTLCAALGIFMLSCCLPLVWMRSNQHIHTSGRQQEKMTIPKAEHTFL